MYYRRIGREDFVVSAFGKEQEQFLLFQFLLFNISRFRETILIHNFRFPRTPSSIARGYSRGGEGERKREREEEDCVGS